MSNSILNYNPRPLIISGYSSQHLSRSIADELGSRYVKVQYKQFDDNEIKVTIEENIRGHEVVIIASASGDPNKQEKEAQLLAMTASTLADAKKVTLVLPYMWYGRSDSNFDERNYPGLVSTVRNLRDHCDSVVVCDPHNPDLTTAAFLSGSHTKPTLVHFAYPFAVQLKSLIEQGVLNRDRLAFAHADAGSSKRIGTSFRECTYNVLGFANRNPNHDDWAQGHKSHDNVTGKTTIISISSDVEGQDLVVNEDMISSGGTICDLATLVKSKGARSLTVFATTGLFTRNRKKGERLTAAIDRINDSDVDAIFITDTYSHKLTDPKVDAAIRKSPIIHEIKTAPYLASIIRALHIEIDRNQEPSGEGRNAETNMNSVSAILRGTHPYQTGQERVISVPVALKPKNPLLNLG